LAGANAVPNEDDIFLWHGNIEIQFNINGNKKSAPMHILILLKDNYPISAPSVGFYT